MVADRTTTPPHRPRYHCRMLACVDADYAGGSTRSACVTFEEWDSENARHEIVVSVDGIPADYEPGELWRRELPGILGALSRVPSPLATILVDAYVTLDPGGHPGLGARLHDALGGRIPVVGVAKSRFRTATMAIPVLRGSSRTPLWITAVGLDPVAAAAGVARMHGPHRIPTLLRRVDRLARGSAPRR